MASARRSFLQAAAPLTGVNGGVHGRPLRLHALDEDGDEIVALAQAEGLHRCGPGAQGAQLAQALSAAGRTPFELDGLRISLQRDAAHFRSLSVIGGNGHVLF